VAHVAVESGWPVPESRPGSCRRGSPETEFETECDAEIVNEDGTEIEVDRERQRPRHPDSIEVKC